MSTVTPPSTLVTAARPAPSTVGAGRSSPARRFFGVVARPGSYRNLAYLLAGLPLGTAWFTVLVTGVSVGASLLVVALAGVPILLGMWYATRAAANVERAVANSLLGSRLAYAPMASGDRGNLWVRLRSASRDRVRRRELGFLALRFPVGVATFTAATVALMTPIMVAWAPVLARIDDGHPFGEWSQSARLEDIASSSPWSWFLVPAGLVLVVAAFHLVNAMARACQRWTTASLGAAPAV